MDTVLLEFFQGDSIAPTTASRVPREDLGWILLVIILKHGFLIEKHEERLILRYPSIPQGMGDEYHAIVDV